MNHSCNLIIDSCCDLPFEVVDREGIELINFPYLLSDGEHSDDLYQTTSSRDFFEGMRKGEEPKTAQLAVSVIEEAFMRAIECGVPTVFLCFSSGLSGSYDVAEMARDRVLEEHPDAELYVVDTKLASVAEGLLVYEAIRQRDKGMNAKELVRWAEEARYYVMGEFMVEDLESLRRGGRIPATVAYAGAKLDVKPLLTFDLDGKLALDGIARGRKKGIKQLADRYRRKAVTAGAEQCVVIGNADCPKDAERLKDQLEKIDSNILFLDSNIGPVIGSHVGPGMIAVVYWSHDRREDISVADKIAHKVKGEKASGGK